MNKKWSTTVSLAVVIMASPISGHADTIYLCKAYGGGMFWTSGTCSAQSATIDRIANVPSGMPFDQQVSIAQGQRADAAANSTATVTSSSSYSSAPPLTGTKAVCDSLSAQVSQLDAMARQPQSGQSQDWISNERKKVRDKQFSLRC